MGGCPWRRASDALSGVPGGPEGPWPTLGAHKLQPCLLELCKFFSQCLCRADQPRTPQRRYPPQLVLPLTDRQAGRHVGRQTDRQLDRQAVRQTDRQSDRHRGEQTDRKVYRQADRQTWRQADIQTDREEGRQTERHTDRQR